MYFLRNLGNVAAFGFAIFFFYGGAKALLSTHFQCNESEGKNLGLQGEIT